MFKAFFEKRIQKDLSKLATARERCIGVLQSKGLSEDEVLSVEQAAHKKAGIAYVRHPDIQATLKIYFASLIEEALKLGHDVA